jgi:hypothetical protein
LDPASTSFILGYHGCDQTVAAHVFSGRKSLRPSENDYDWLGDGIYFWEHNAQRAYQFACEIRDGIRPGKRPINKPAVVGAVIDLGLCLNLLDSRYILMVQRAYEDLVENFEEVGTPLPSNSLGADRLLRKLDCAVIRMLHETRKRENEAPFDTIRAAFIEGGPLYENAGFAAKNHIQVCVRNITCIKGYFRPLDDHGQPMSFP